jgi:hypothetical protein
MSKWGMSYDTPPVESLFSPFCELSFSVPTQLATSVPYLCHSLLDNWGCGFLMYVPLPQWLVLWDSVETGPLGSGSVAQWQSTCLACAIPWDWSLALLGIGSYRSSRSLPTQNNVFSFLPSFLPPSLFSSLLNPGPSYVLGKCSTTELNSQLPKECFIIS